LLEPIFDALDKAPDDKALREYLVRLYRFYLSLCASGLTIHDGDFGGGKIDRKNGGAHGVIYLPNELCLVFTALKKTEHGVELELAAAQTDNRLSIVPVRDGWQLTFLRDEEHPHVEFERLAALYDVDDERGTVRLDSMRFRGYLRELSRLSRPVEHEAEPAHP
jgi:hypothetical protein